MIKMYGNKIVKLQFVFNEDGEDLKTIINRTYNSKINIYDIPKDYKNHINDNTIKTVDSFDNIYENTNIYYTNIDIKKINKMDDKEFLDNMKNYNLICTHK